jgi:F-box protein 21
MRVDDLDRGRHQPFYTSLVLDERGTQRCRLHDQSDSNDITAEFLCIDIAEENIEPIGLPEVLIEQFFEKHPIMAMYFQGVEFEDSAKPSRRWRMNLSPESKSSYPEDDAMGSAWVRDGILPELCSRRVLDSAVDTICDIA